MYVMLVDDEVRILRGVSRFLSQRWSELTIREFENGFDALDSLAGQMPDLLIADIHMPEMDGLELIEKAAAAGVRHYALLTGYEEFSLVQRALRLRAVDYLLKPVDKEQLYNVVEQVMREVEAQEGTEASLARAINVCRAQAENPAQAADALDKLLRSIDGFQGRLEIMRRFLNDTGRQQSAWETVRLIGDYASRAEAERLQALGKWLGESSLADERKPKEIEAALHSIHEGFGSPLTLQQVASDVFMTPSYFSTLFHRETGERFVDYVNRVRIDNACYLILETEDWTVDTVAANVGFHNTHYFFKVFKKYTGLTPGAFRQIAR